ncbi:MAG TPA: hypothetical protein VFI76_03370, partial [Terrimicrobiaceae bacterium]|nr:hypothetical protein [Terrimicrobiaceae bacterium]
MISLTLQFEEQLLCSLSGALSGGGGPSGQTCLKTQVGSGRLGMNNSRLIRAVETTRSDPQRAFNCGSRAPLTSTKNKESNRFERSNPRFILLFLHPCTFRKGCRAAVLTPH